MTLGERIKSIRQLRGMTQKELGNAIGLTATRIGHYEMDFRKPKKETLKAIANALHVGVSIFQDIDIDTLCDVKSILFQLDDKIGVKFHGEKGDDGKFKAGTVTLSFDNPQIAVFLKEWADMWSVLSDFENESKKNEEQIQKHVTNEIANMKKNFENASYAATGSSIIVSKNNTSNINVKLSSDISDNSKKSGNT